MPTTFTFAISINLDDLKALNYAIGVLKAQIDYSDNPIDRAEKVTIFNNLKMLNEQMTQKMKLELLLQEEVIEDESKKNIKI